MNFVPQVDKETQNQILSRRTFCIISHPDAGKTTVTEKFLYFAGAIQQAGTVKARKSKKFAASDWMEIEKQRGISVSASILSFMFEDYQINLLDTPGHHDFIEETFRSLTAVDSALMIIDGTKGVEQQTLKLWQICQKQKIPVIAFINKLDRECIAPLDLLSDIEQALAMNCVALTWPIGAGKDFKGVYDRQQQKIFLFAKEASLRSKDHQTLLFNDKPSLLSHLGEHHYQQLQSDLQLLEGAGTAFNHSDYLQAKQLPVFFGSAINNFGILELLQSYLQLSSPPCKKKSSLGFIEPTRDKCTAFVFKIQSNMDKNHRDRIVFMRICSGKFYKGMKLMHSRLQREIKIANPIFFMADKRANIDCAYAGDIIGVVDTNNFIIGDSLGQAESLHFYGLPRFSAEFFAKIQISNPLKSKQLMKALLFLSKEGTIQLFYSPVDNSQIIGVVGRLQLEVVSFRLKHEYNIDCQLSSLPFSLALWIKYIDNDQKNAFKEGYYMQVFKDEYDNDVFMANSKWELDFILQKYPQISFIESSDDLI